MDELLNLAKRLADYVRMTIETGELKSESPIGIAYRDFIEEWDKRHLTTESSDQNEDRACQHKRVYFSAEHSNFYCSDCRKGMGQHFFNRNYADRQSFSQEPHRGLL